jgi:hypothetical protein
VAIQVAAKDLEVPFIRKELFTIAGCGRTLNEVISGGFNSIGKGFIFAGQMDFKELIPEATKIAIRYKGNQINSALPYGDYSIDETGSSTYSAPGGLTLAQAIA